MNYRTGHHKFNKLNCTLIGSAIASGDELPADVQADVVSLRAFNKDFDAALQKEINKVRNQIEFGAACAANPKLYAMTVRTRNGFRDWRKLLAAIK